MRFVYGTILGILVTVISAILYLAFAGGHYLLLLSPKYHEMQSAMASCRRAEEQRDLLVKRLETLERSYDDITRRFNGLQEMAGRPPAPAPAPSPTEAPAAEAEAAEPTAGP